MDGERLRRSRCISLACTFVFPDAFFVSFPAEGQGPTIGTPFHRRFSRNDDDRGVFRRRCSLLGRAIQGTMAILCLFCAVIYVLLPFLSWPLSLFSPSFRFCQRSHPTPWSHPLAPGRYLGATRCFCANVSAATGWYGVARSDPFQRRRRDLIRRPAAYPPPCPFFVLTPKRPFRFPQLSPHEKTSRGVRHRTTATTQPTQHTKRRGQHHAPVGKG